MLANEVGPEPIISVRPLSLLDKSCDDPVIFGALWAVKKKAGRFKASQLNREVGKMHP